MSRYGRVGLSPSESCAIPVTTPFRSPLPPSPSHQSLCIECRSDSLSSQSPFFISFCCFLMPTSPRPSLTIQTRMRSQLPEQRLDLPVPATPPPQRRARSTSPKGTPTHRGTPRSTSPGYRYGGSTASPRPDHGSPSLGGPSYEPAVLSGGISGIGRAVGQRLLRTARRGNLPFLIVFVSYVPLPEIPRRDHVYVRLTCLDV